MSFPPPPGYQPPSSLPPRPPPSSNANPQYGPSAPNSGYGGNASRPGYGAATAFQPRSVASQQPYRTSSPVVSAAPSTQSSYSNPSTTNYGSYYSQPQQSYQADASYYGSSQYNGATYGPTVPHIQNPFAPSGDQSNGYGARGRGFGRNDSGLDAETEAQIAQWQSAYANKDDLSATGKSTIRRDVTTGTPGVSTTVYTSSGSTPATSTPTPIAGPEPQKTVARSGGGQTWTDSSLLEWDPAHFRLFVGNLAGEVTDDSLFKAFSKYTSVQKARVIRDKRTQKSKGYGFVSFSDGDDYFKAAREMQGKYIGSHPVLLRRATTEIRPVSNNKNKKHGGKGGGGGGQGSKTKNDGVKKPGKTKGGLKILG
ncbi:RNP domain protein [Aspergillus lucknowensis]|uniref:RRM domain-containing protein n=1 Tax=Aspergillus lucknowensis TaxID=176173 RepID=A0ABR4M336_9EURO